MKFIIEHKSENIPIIHILSFLILGWMSGGMLRLIPLFNAYIMLVLFIMWFTLVIVSDKKFISRMFSESGWLIILIFTLLPSSIFVHGGFESITINLIFIFIIHTVYIYYKNKLNQEFVKRMVVFLIIDKIIIAIYTINMLNIYPELSRELASGRDIALVYAERLTLVAGFAFLYASVLLVIYILVIQKDLQNKYRILSIIYLVITTFMIIKASYTTALIVLFLFGILAVLLKRRQYILMLIIVIITTFFYQEIAKAIYQISDWSIWSSVLSIKFKIFADFILGKSIDGTSLALRSDLVYKSITTFKDNIIFGVYENVAYREYIGGHSQWIDLLATLGVGRFGFLLMYARTIFKRAFMLNKHNHGISLVVLYVAVMGFLNPILYHDLALNILVVIPFLSAIEKDVETKENKTIVLGK